MKLLLSFLLALFHSFVMEAYNGTVEIVSFKYEVYQASSYAPTIKEVTYKYNGSAYVIEGKDDSHGVVGIPPYIDKTIIDGFVDTLAARGKVSNAVSFSSQDIKACMSFVNDGRHTDIPMILSSYEMDDNYLTENLAMLCSLKSSYLQTLLDSLHENTRKPFFCITLRLQDGRSIDVHPNSFYESDNWCLGKNNYINDEYVTNFLVKTHLQHLFIPLEREYMMVHLMGLYKKCKINLDAFK